MGGVAIECSGIMVSAGEPLARAERSVRMSMSRSERIPRAHFGLDVQA
jgi:hypothetical protein